MADSPASTVQLVDLEVIVRYSLAIRQELAPAEEVLAALDESRAMVLALLEGREPDEEVEPREPAVAPRRRVRPEAAPEDDDPAAPSAE